MLQTVCLLLSLPTTFLIVWLQTIDAIRRNMGNCPVLSVSGEINLRFYFGPAANTVTALCTLDVQLPAVQEASLVRNGDEDGIPLLLLKLCQNGTVPHTCQRKSRRALMLFHRLSKRATILTTLLLCCPSAGYG